MVNIYVTIL